MVAINASRVIAPVSALMQAALWHFYKKVNTQNRWTLQTVASLLYIYNK